MSKMCPYRINKIEKNNNGEKIIEEVFAECISECPFYRVKSDKYCARVKSELINIVNK